MKLRFLIPRIGKISLYVSLISWYYIAILVFGRSNSVASMFLWILALFWFVMVFKKVQKYIHLANMTGATILMFFLIFYLSIWDLCKYGMVSFGSSLFRYFLVFLPFYMFVYTYNQEFSVVEKHLFFMLFIYVCLTIAQCILYITAEDPEYARNIIGTDRSYFAFIADAYGLCQAASFLAIAGFSYMLIKGKKFTTLLFFLLNSLIIILTKSTLMILCCGSVIAYLIINLILDKLVLGWIKGECVRRLIKISFFIIGFLAIPSLSKLIGYVFIDFSGDETGVVASRFRELGGLLTNKELSRDLIARFSAYTTSIKTAIRHPLLGNYLAYNIGDYDVIGGHSEIIDMVARFGFPVTVLFFGLIYYFLKAEIKITGIQIPGLSLLYTLFIVVNPFNYYIAYFALFYIAPLMVYVKKVRNKGAY